MCVHRSYMCGCFLVLYFFSTIFRSFSLFFFFFNDTATTEIYTLSLHDALPISRRGPDAGAITLLPIGVARHAERRAGPQQIRSEEHTSELQSLAYLVCRLLLEKKKKNITRSATDTHFTLPLPTHIRST